MKTLSFLLDGHPHYNFLEACVAQGLRHLGHIVYGAFGSSENFCTPHSGEGYDVYLQCIDNPKTDVPTKVPRVYLWGDDSGKDPVPVHYPNFKKVKADLLFIRDYRGGAGPKVYPMNFGIEDRFFCAHDGSPKPLVDRQYDVTFLGRQEAYKGREGLFKQLREALNGECNLFIDEMIYRKPDKHWSQWVRGHCVHDPRYYEALADSKIVLSPLGAGPDCARHWEALASGGIPLIQGMPTIQVPPALRAGHDCLVFNDADGAVSAIRSVLANLADYQRIADMAFQNGKEFHTTEARAQYLVNTCEAHGLIR